ncbi:ABC transporter substrate-binding protein [Pseudomonas sp. R2.Fl]|nr:ABC transporter substrate-binding protein [Pseudomonas sp. R2.Fl]
MSLKLSRRRLFAGTLGALALAASSGHAEDRPSRIVSLDYGLASTLMMFGITPIAVASLADWDIWVIEPEMPSSVIDLGNSWEVNFEILATLKPDLILTTPYLDALKPRLETYAPVLRLDVYSPDGGDVLTKAANATRQLAAAVGKEREGEEFLARAEAFFYSCRARIERLDAPPVALLGFLDARHVRVYASPGLYDNVLKRIGLENAWPREGNYWGFDTIGIEDLSKISDPSARLIAFEPLPADVLPKLAQSPLWNALPFSRPGQFTVIPGALMFGMVNDAMRCARLLTDHLEKLA